MYDFETRFAAYKRGFIYFLIYSIVLFLVISEPFFQIKTLFYFLVGTAISGAVAVLFMSLQSKIEKNLKSNFWILNILIDVIGYFIYTYLVFILFFS